MLEHALEGIDLVKFQACSLNQVWRHNLHMCGQLSKCSINENITIEITGIKFKHVKEKLLFFFLYSYQVNLIIGDAEISIQSRRFGESYYNAILSSNRDVKRRMDNLRENVGPGWHFVICGDMQDVSKRKNMQSLVLQSHTSIFSICNKGSHLSQHSPMADVVFNARNL